MSFLLVATCVFCLFILYEILLRAARSIHPVRAVKVIDAYCEAVVDRIFSLLRAYCDLEIGFERKADQALPERFLLLANHQSLLDIALCMKLLKGKRLRFVAKEELGGGIPFISSVLRTQGHALVKRHGAMKQSMDAIHLFARRCRKEGTCPVVFPEGTRSRDGELGPFYTAGARKVLDVDRLPIVVATIDGGWRISRFKDFFGDFRGMRYRFRISAVLPPPEGKKEASEAIALARRVIEADLAEMRSRPV